MEFTIHETVFELDGLLINIPSKEKVQIDEDISLERKEWLWCLAHMFCPKRCSVINCIEHQPTEEIVEAYVALKRELKKHRNEVAKVDEKLRPRTLAEVDELREKLRTALGELDSHRAKLEGK